MPQQIYLVLGLLGQGTHLGVVHVINSFNQTLHTEAESMLHADRYSRKKRNVQEVYFGATNYLSLYAPWARCKICSYSYHAWVAMIGARFKRWTILLGGEVLKQSYIRG